eukprot:8808089-Ditylum_brightwellii.AAC.1
MSHMHQPYGFNPYAQYYPTMMLHQVKPLNIISSIQRVAFALTAKPSIMLSNAPSVSTLLIDAMMPNNDSAANTANQSIAPSLTSYNT